MFVNFRVQGSLQFSSLYPPRSHFVEIIWGHITEIFWGTVSRSQITWDTFDVISELIRDFDCRIGELQNLLEVRGRSISPDVNTKDILVRALAVQDRQYVASIEPRTKYKRRFSSERSKIRPSLSDFERKAHTVYGAYKRTEHRLQSQLSAHCSIQTSTQTWVAVCAPGTTQALSVAQNGVSDRSLFCQKVSNEWTDKDEHRDESLIRTLWLVRQLRTRISAQTLNAVR